MSLILLQFPISHYCEKVRWALDFKSIPYQKRNLLPGMHLIVMKRLGLQTSVPAIEFGGRYVQGSSQIIDCLDEKYPQRPLTPADSALADEAREWERYADDNVGVHLRRVMYQTLLQHPDVVIRFFATDGRWYSAPFLRCTFPLLRNRMRAAMNINAQTAKASEETLAEAIATLSERLQSREFLVGDCFTRADLAAAALLAPLRMPAEYGLPWPDTFPPEIDRLINRFDSSLDWVDELYANYRLPPAA